MKRRKNFCFCEKFLTPSSWSLFFEGGFAKYGGLLRIKTGSLKSSMKHESESGQSLCGFVFVV